MKCKVGSATAEETTVVAAEEMLTIAAEGMTAVISGEMASGRRKLK